MKNCKKCHKNFTPKPQAHNVKFCSVACREKHYDETMVCRQKEYVDARNHEKWNKFAPGKFQCPFCSGWYRALLHHVWQRHDMSESEYKKRFGYNHSTTFITQELKEIKREKVFENGTVKNLTKGAKTRYVKGDKRAGRYERRPETLKVLKNLWQKRK